MPTDLIEVDGLTHKTIVNELHNNNKEISVVNGNITLVEKQQRVIENNWNQVRSKRKKLLADCDYTQLPDYPTNKKSEWASYRQELRDIPQKYKNISDIVWPSKPN